MKGNRIIILLSLQKVQWSKLHINKMGIERTRLLVLDYIYWISINADIETTIKNFSVCFHFQMTQLKDRLLPHKIPGRPWKSARADIFP